MTQDTKIEFCRHEVDQEVPIDGIYEADVLKIGFCPSCGTTILIMGDHEHDVAFVHLPLIMLDGVIGDLQSIRQRLRN
jgi:hypothetical protein